MQRILRGGEATTLNVCGCGKLHFSYGPLTLHFDHAEFARFSEEVRQIAVQLDAVNISLASSRRRQDDSNVIRQLEPPARRPTA